MALWVPNVLGPISLGYFLFPWASRWTLQKPPLLNPPFLVPEEGSFCPCTCSLGNHGRMLHSFSPFTRMHSLHSCESWPLIRNARLFTNFLFTIFATLTPPPNQQNDGFPLEFLLKGPQTELRTLGQNCEQTLQKLRTNRIMNKRAFLNYRRNPKGWFPKGWFWWMFPRNEKPERGYVRMFPRNEKPERGYVRMFPQNENRNEGTFAKTTLLQNRPFISCLEDRSLLK